MARFGSAFGLDRLSVPRWQDKRLFLGRPEANIAKGGPLMVANALLLKITILLAPRFWLLGELKFFIPKKGRSFP
jgi:hypothetical protein